MNQKYIALIKILKFWNYLKKKGLQNHRIEQLVCGQFWGFSIDTRISTWMCDFFNNNGFAQDGNKMAALMYQDNINDSNLEQNWNNFIG
jgi:hypothetical protein